MNGMTRQEHLEWCKKRAMEYVDAGDCTNAVNSMISDLTKHPETDGHCGSALGLFAKTPGDVRKWIEGFN